MALVIITGMSGAGKSRGINVLEDLGYYCVDNLPPKFLVSFADLYGMTDEKESRKIATVVDIRGKDMFPDFFKAMDELRKRDYPYKILFLDADENVLIKRYKETRRLHPLIDDQGVTLDEAIKQERKMLEHAREISDYVIDTSGLLPAQLKERMVAILSEDGNAKTMLVQMLSFGYKNGLPAEADIVFDVRCLPNPFYIPELRDYTGKDEKIRKYVMSFSESRTYFKKLVDMITFLLPLYVKEGKGQLVIAFGCTGGKHRSVLFAEMLGEHLEKNGWRTSIEHRDITKGLHGVPSTN